MTLVQPTTVRKHKPLQNNLLAALPSTQQPNFFSKLGLVKLPIGKVMYESGSDELYV
jgi:hypothetical protein